MEFSNEEIAEFVKNIEMCKVFSTNLVAIGYNSETKILRVIFKGNSSYLYFNVEPEVYELISNSDSKGKTLNEQVVRQKEKYKYIKLNS